MNLSEFTEKVRNNIAMYGLILGFGIGATTYFSMSAATSVAVSEPSTVVSASTVSTGGDGGAGGAINCQGGAGEGGDPMVENAVDVVGEMDWIPVEEDPLMANPSQRCPLDPLCELGDDAT